MAARPLAVITGLLLLSGCSGSRFGEQLSRSFSAPTSPATPTTPDLKPPGAAKELPEKPKPAAIPTAPATTVKPPLPVPVKANLPATAPLASAPLAPAPYRVTIKLPSADPSAPAEIVTRALRSAGVSFEVETIERVRPGATAAPAPAPR
ncbi:hypothetical protein KBY58_00155 [Cyanobium sp. HWJ4-Hawea]|uniref:hypothetical protein n=1 Tax=Cyanobium sp. HWJ4-Hawea TaxID=2823713 RepID=UPI0020CD93C4|nr:hypothetical protein [Cyanobium sp. HWJ4-Hawea]MCP9807847.1 hypothetical protein [Cyanobium sp. HWJ4-Hawea]